MKARALFSLCLAAAIGLWLAMPLPALAHSKLLRSNPVAGALLDTPPQMLQLSFSEVVGLQFSSIKLLDRTRAEQTVGPLEHPGDIATDVEVGIPNKLGPGTYTVVWQMLSAIDGHLTAGTFAFRVRATGGTPEPVETPVPFEVTEQTPLEGRGESADPFRWVIRGIILAAAALLTGGPLFTVLVVEPTVAERGEAGAALWRVAGRRFAKIGWGAAGLLLLALLADLVAEVAAIGATSLWGAFARTDVAVQLISTTRYGFAWSMKALAAALLLGMFAWLANRRMRADDRLGSGLWEISIAAGSFLLLAEAFSSHGAAIDTAHVAHFPLPVVSDWLHLVTASAWVGGLGYMVLALFPAFRVVGFSPEERRTFLARSVPRFSRLALLSVVTLVISGTYNLVIHSTDVAAILSSGYGQVLVIKHVLLLILIGIGAVNLLRLSPRLRRQPPDAPPVEQELAATRPAVALRRNVRVEFALTALVLLCAGGLTLLPPPSGSSNTYAAGPPAGTSNNSVDHTMPTAVSVTPGPATATSSAAGYTLVLETRPSIEGDELTLTVTKALAASPPLTDVSKVLFKVTPQDLSGGSTSYVATRQAGADPNLGVWHLREQILTLDGRYMVTAILQRTQSPDLKAAFRLDLSETTGLTASAAQVVDVKVSTDPSPPITGTANVTVTLIDGEGRPVEGADVELSPLMPAHAHIEPTGIAKPVPGQPGVYSMPVYFQMGGSWLLIFNIERDGLPTVKTDASLDVIDPNATPTPVASPSP